MTKPSVLRVGDGVRLRGYSEQGTDVDGEKGTLTESYQDGTLWRVEIHSGLPVMVKPSQCVKLVPKKRRRVWIPTNYPHQETVRIFSQKPDESNPILFSEGPWIEFVEARPCPMDGAPYDAMGKCPAKDCGKHGRGK